MNVADLVPFWLTPVMRRESVLFIAESAHEAAAAALLFAPSAIHDVASADGTARYAEGVDYTVDRATGRLRLAHGSRIPAVTRAALHPAEDRAGNGFMHVHGDPSRFLLFAEGDVFHRLQTEVTYTHSPVTWPSFQPAAAHGAPSRTLGRLEHGEPVALCVIGDSISEGYNASGFVGAPPEQPPYASLVARGLHDLCGSRVSLTNLAQAGTSSADGVYAAEQAGTPQPDLVIVAFGMNDAGYVTAADFAANVAAIMATVRRAAPDAEFVLVAPMLPHPAWHYTPVTRFAEYRDQLAALCRDGVALADMTRLWTDLLSRKSVYDLTGNGINHPNDFGHRLYAQVILSLLVDPARWPRA